jgi:hypothetical protein
VSAVTGGPDRSRLAVARLLAALPAALYDVRLVPADGVGPAEVRRLDAAGVLAALPWLRARNAAGRHIYLRPLDPRHVLVDDLDAAALRMLRGAHAVAAIVETSPGSHQAWLTAAPGEVEPARAAALASNLARRYGGDPGAASAVQLGRLPGTTNRKGRHVRADGTYPYALLRHARACIDAAARALLDSLLVAPHLHDRESLDAPTPTTDDAREMAEGYERLRTALGGELLDRSRADHAVAHRQLARGVAADRVVSMLLAGERATGLPAPAALDYARRTVAAALRASVPGSDARSDRGRAPAGARDVARDEPMPGVPAMRVAGSGAPIPPGSAP